MFELVKTSSHTWFKQSVNSNLCCWSPHFPYKTDSLFNFYYPSWINQPIKYPLSHTSPKQNETHDMNIWFKLFYFYFFLFLLLFHFFIHSVLFNTFITSLWMRLSVCLPNPRSSFHSSILYLYLFWSGKGNQLKQHKKLSN